MIAIHDQNYENIVDSKHAKGDCFPLCFSSFEMLKRRSKGTYKIMKFEVMENFINFLEMDDKKEEQSCDQSQHLKKPVVCNEELNHKEEDEGSKWDVPLCFSNSEILCQEEIILLD